MYDDSFTDSGNEGSNFGDDKEETKSSVRVHDSYDDNNGEHTPNISTFPILVNDDEDDCDRNVDERETFFRRKRYRGSFASATLTVVLSGGEGNSRGSVMQMSRSLDPGTFQ